MAFLSEPPRVRLYKAFESPFRNTVATARTCYSAKGPIEDGQVGNPEKYGSLARSLYEAGHHTTFQHAHFQFVLENVSRQFIWSFLHAHPFYNSEQVSQRYVSVKPEAMTTPDLPPDQLAVYREQCEFAYQAYQQLCAILEGPAAAEYHKRFRPSPRMEKKHRGAIRKKAMEIARYVLPLATTAYLYHTVSAITLLRYWRLANQEDCPAEQRYIIGRMVEELLRHDPDYEMVLQEPLEPEELPESRFFAARPNYQPGSAAGAFRDEFDRELGALTSRLISWPQNGEQLVADAVREVLGQPRAALSDEEAVSLALNPAVNTTLGDSLNLTTIQKLSRTLFHPHFTFKKKISHTADSQDQRHRMTPGSRPILAAHLDDQPDYITPALIAQSDEAASFYRETMERTWERIARLRRMGAANETLAYLLPNAVSVRFTESSDLLNLFHKHRMRLCYNAQEEIWTASREEAQQIRDALPMIGKWLLPPCTLRATARQKPICPEGPRYCGVRVWKLDIDEFERVI